MADTEYEDCSINNYGMNHFKRNWDFVTDREMEHRLHDVRTIAEKDMRISELMSEKISDQKDIELYKQLRSDIKNEIEPLKDDIKELQHFAREQAVYNGVNTATVAGIKQQVEELLHLSVRKIPNYNVCPGWGDVNVTPNVPMP